MNALRDDLEEIAATPRPVGALGVSASMAVRRGRRIRRRRQALVAGGAALVIAAGGGALALPGHDGGGRGRTVQAAPAGYGTILTKEAVFGWLPDGYSTIRTSQGDDGYVLAAGPPGMKAGGLTLQLTRGAEPPVPKLPGARPGRRTATAPVHGRPAYWVIKPGTDGSDQVPAEFRWQYRDGRWAELIVVDRKAATEATVRRIAEGVRFDTGEAVAFPFRIGGVPAGMRIAQASVAGPSEVDLLLVPDHATAASDGFAVVLSPAARDTGAPSRGADTKDAKDAKDRQDAPNTKVDGYPARGWMVKDSATGSAGESLVVFGWHGMDLRVELRGRSYRPLVASGGARAVVARIAYLGADQRKWTTAPLGG